MMFGGGHCLWIEKAERATDWGCEVGMIESSRRFERTNGVKEGLLK